MDQPAPQTGPDLPADQPTGNGDTLTVPGNTPPDLSEDASTNGSSPSLNQDGYISPLPSSPMAPEPSPEPVATTPAVAPVANGLTPTAPTPAPVVNGNGPAASVAQVLVKKEFITSQQLAEVQAESINKGTEVEALLLEKELINEEQLAEAKAEYYNIEFIRLAEIGTSPEALNVVPEGVAQRYEMLPFGIDKEKNQLKVAMANPLDLRAIDFVEKKTGYRIQPFLATESDLKMLIPEQYAQSLSSEVTAALKETGTEKKKVVDVKQLGEVIREAPIAKIVETVLSFAMKARASDIHIEPQEAKTRIRYRIDGILHEKLVLPKGVQDAVVSRIKILADLKIDEKRLPQDGRFTFSVGEEEVDLRISTLPTVHGEKVVMRLLKKTQKVPTMQELGLRGMALKNLEESIRVPHGIILITGPTGSGKTTSLYAILNKINTPKVNIVTLEDPVEYEIPGVNQVQINPKAGLTFASGLRSFLRQDPNIIEVGEIRDKETAELAIQASLTGHLVFSTLHTNSAAGALPRLQDMEAEPFLLASSMTCVVAQRVCRKICSHCKTTYKPEAPVVEDFKKVLGKLFDAWLEQKKIKAEDLVLSHGEGCPECNDTGYSGRIGIFEVLPVTEKVGRLVMERAPAIEIEKQAVQDGMILMKMDGYLKVLEGISTIEEVLRVAQI